MFLFYFLAESCSVKMLQRCSLLLEEIFFNKLFLYFIALIKKNKKMFFVLFPWRKLPQKFFFFKKCPWFLKEIVLLKMFGVLFFGRNCPTKKFYKKNMHCLFLASIVLLKMFFIYFLVKYKMVPFFWQSCHAKNVLYFILLEVIALQKIT